MRDQNYPNANVWQRVEIDVEPEPALDTVSATLRLPAAWPDERQQAWMIAIDTAKSAS